MNEWVKTLLTSTVVAGAVSWLTTSHKIEQELHSRQGEAAYEALIEANRRLWNPDAQLKNARPEGDGAMSAEAPAVERNAGDQYVAATLKIAAFGDARVVEALSNYYRDHGGAAKACPNKKKYESDTKIYKAIRDTLGVGGNVSDEQLANIIFLCSLENKAEGEPSVPSNAPPAAPP